MGDSERERRRGEERKDRKSGGEWGREGRGTVYWLEPRSQGREAGDCEREGLGQCTVARNGREKGGMKGESEGWPREN